MKLTSRALVDGGVRFELQFEALECRTVALGSSFDHGAISDHLMNLAHAARVIEHHKVIGQDPMSIDAFKKSLEAIVTKD